MPSHSPFRRSSPAPTAATSPDKNARTGSPEIAFGQRWKPGPRPAFSTTGKPEDVRRRESSVQFNTGPAEATIRRESTAPRMSINERRMSSPPPPRTYQRGVSFDTFDNRDATDFSLTLNYKHKDYHNTRRSRTFLCGTDQKDYSDFALEWLIEELIDDGDEIVCLRVVEKDSKIASESSVEQGKYRQEAQKLLEQVIKKNSVEEKAISFVIELAVGRVQEIIQRMIQIYEPAVLVVGTRGKSLGGMQGLMPGSVSKYCLQSSPIPVIVVRPSRKRNKKKMKRMGDTNRRAYNKILDQGGHVLDKTNRSSIIGPLPEATDQEADAVAKAIGLPKNYKPPKYGGPLTRVTSTKSDTSEQDDDEGPKEGFFPAGYMRTLSPDPVSLALKSPSLAALDEPWTDSASDEETKLTPNPKPKDENGNEIKAKAIRPSFSEDPPWLRAILAKPEIKRRPSYGRTTTR